MQRLTVNDLAPEVLQLFDQHGGVLHAPLEGLRDLKA